MKVHKENSRSTEQTVRMELAIKKNICPFCKKGLVEIHRQQILKETNDFFVTPNAFPYDGTKIHYLIVPKTHITSIQDIPIEKWAQVGELFNWVLNNKKIDDGGMFIRFGDVHKTGSSVSHIHFQIISGTKSDTDTGSVGLRVKLGYK